MAILIPDQLKSRKVIYDEVGQFADNGLAKVMLIVSKAERFGFIDQSSKVLVPIVFESACLFDSNGLAKVKINNKWGFINLLGEETIPPMYDAAEYFREGLVKVCQHSKWGFLDTQGKVIVQLQYDWAYEFSEGLAIVRNGNKYGAIDRNGEVIVPLVYDGMKPLSNGLFAAKQGRKWGYINADGTIQIPITWDDAWSFNNGSAQVRIGVDFHTIGLKGETFDVPSAVKFLQ